MTFRHLFLAQLILVTSSTIWAQNVSVVTFSAGSFGHDHSFTWSQDSSAVLTVTPVLAQEIMRQTREQLENVGLSLVAQDDRPLGDVLVRVRCFNSAQPSPLILAIEIYDTQSRAMIWRGEAKSVLNQRDMRASLLIVDRTIAKMFEHFPYHLNGWMFATHR
jgi:hypothetical protein